MNLPTQYELATIAATIQGTPHECARAALAVWKACGEALTREAEFHRKIESHAEKSSAIDTQFSPGDHVFLGDFLKGVLPSSKVERRMKVFRDFARDYISVTRRMNAEYGQAGGEELTKEQLDERVANWIGRLRSEGMRRDIAIYLAPKFEMHVQCAESTQRRERSKRGGEGKKAKNSLGKLPTPKKTPQAKPKPPQASRKPPQA
jgi:hypothetical protein